jgi:hypothetical protein
VNGQLPQKVSLAVSQGKPHQEVQQAKDPIRRRRNPSVAPDSLSFATPKAVNGQEQGEPQKSK